MFYYNSPQYITELMGLVIKHIWQVRGGRLSYTGVPIGDTKKVKTAIMHFAGWN